jgi:hypothetical protein
MSEMISPPVRVLDFGYTSPTSIDYTRAGLALTAPAQQAVQAATDTRSQFLLTQLNAQKAMELAKWNHQAQIQREQMRDQRMMQVAELRAKSQLDALKAKGLIDDEKSKQAYLTNRLGGDPVSKLAGESDEAYSARLDAAIKGKLQGNIATDAKAAYSIKKQIAAYTNYINDPRLATPAVLNEFRSAAQDPGVQAQAQNYVNTNFGTWLQRVAGDNADVIQNAIQQAPGQTWTILQRAGLGDAYNSFVGSATQQAAYSYLKVAGSPASKQFATANENLRILGQQFQNISAMPGDNGRMVPKPWWSQVQNSVDDMTLHDAQMDQQTNSAAQSVVPATAARAGASVANVVNPPITFGVTAGGAAPEAPPVVAPYVNPLSALRTPGGLPAPSGAGKFYLDGNNQVQYSGNVVNPFTTPVLNPFAPGNHTLYSATPSPADQSWMKNVAGSRMFQNLVSPPAVAPAAPSNGVTVPAGFVGPVRGVVQQPNVISVPSGFEGPVRSGMPTSANVNSIVPPLPSMTPVNGATISPFTGMMPAPQATSVDGSGFQNPYDNVAQMMQQRAMMASVYGN